MTTSSTKALHARSRARTLRRAGGRTVAVLGFAALTWAAFTGTAMAVDGAEQSAHQSSGPASGPAAATTARGTDVQQSGIPLGDAVGSLTHDAVRGLTSAAGTATSETTTSETGMQGPAPAAVEPTETSTAQDGQAATGSPGSTGLLDSAVHGLTTYAVPQSSTTPTDDPTTATRPASAQTQTGELSILGLVSGAESAVNDLSGNVLTATQLDQTLPAPKVEVLTDTLEALAVTEVLPTVPLPQLPVIDEPALDDLTGALVTPLPVPDPGMDAPIQTSPAAAVPQQSDPAMSGALPVLPILLPVEGFPGLGSIDSPATFASLADGGFSSADQGDVYLSRALLRTSDADAGDSSVPLPSGPAGPAGGPDGGSGSSHQQGGQLSSFTLPGGGLVSLVRDYRWHLPATPTFDPGFSPD